MRKAVRNAAACLIALAAASSSTAEVHCVGDCNGDGLITVDELIVGVTITLGPEKVLTG